MKSPLVTVVVLSYNRPHYLGDALQSVAAQTYSQLEVLVVDNPSPQSEAIREIVEQHPEMILVQPDRNLGFAAGMNEGIRRATGDYIYLTEDDIVLDPECVAAFVAHAATGTGRSLATGLMLNYGDRSIRCAGGEVSLAPIMRLTVFGQGERDLRKYDRPFEVNFIPGAMVFADRETWNALKGFREDFFMYFEDTELCLRALKQGYKILVVPTAQALHFEPNEPVRDYVDFHKLKNIFKLYLLHAHRGVWPAFFLRYAVVDLLKAAIGNHSRFWLLLRALWTVGSNVPRLLRERSMSVSRANS
ncbi:MAG TPA: glycosyltransferase family 2 protein [Bryobacteraceae bacterium]|nr:glycosyltransferase family 2 protein [Bryobacteraceae bacterium]